MKRNPDDFTLLHRIRFKVRQYKVGLAIEVYDGSTQIARGKFFKGPWTAMPWQKVVEAVVIEVEKPWQRKGVASAIYRKVEELGYTIHPSSAQTPSGHKLWQGGRWEKREEVINSGILSRWKTEYARANPPKDIDADSVLGAECAVWALAAASGRSVPDVRRAFMDAGIDIWGESGLAKGTPLPEIRRMVQKLDIDKRIVYVGYSYPFERGVARHATSKHYTSQFMYGKDPDQYQRDQSYAEGFQLPEGHTSGASRATVGMVMRHAKKKGLAALAIVGRFRVTRSKVVRSDGSRGFVRNIGGTTHILGYSPSAGFFDSAVTVPYARALESQQKTGTWLKGGDWYRHGQEIPDPSRPALLWVYFKGE